MTTGAVRCILDRICLKLAEQYERFAGLKFAPHDFRRLFTTDLVNSGLPIHIGAALLGHLNLETTRGYVAVFNEDVVRHYQTTLSVVERCAHRRNTGLSPRTSGESSRSTLPLIADRLHAIPGRTTTLLIWHAVAMPERGRR